MHPIEGILYESAVLIPLFFTHHPIMINFIKIDLNYAAILGHDGHEYPAHGDWFHTIHHMKIKGNYGSPNTPWDWLFGSIDYGEEMEDTQLEEGQQRYLKELMIAAKDQKEAE